MKSPCGPLFLVASSKGLQAVTWVEQPIKFQKSFGDQSPHARHLQKAQLQLKEYFLGERKEFDLVFDIQGTEFQKKVWDALCQIPHGQTCSYQDIAKKIKNAKAVRAVGSANGRNSLCIIIPCHRVISADGRLGGYSGGLSYKIKLLEIEGIKFA